MEINGNKQGRDILEPLDDRLDSQNEKAIPLITTILPTYRRPAMLKRAVESVLNQTYPYFQLCVYDDASGDETKEIVAEYAREDPRVKYYCNKENIGLGKNYFYGFSKVDTPYFSFLSDDDVLLPWFYETVMAEFKKYPSAGFAVTGTIRMDEQGAILGVPVLAWQPGYYEAPGGLYTMLQKSHPNWTGVMWRKEVRDKLNVTPENIGSDMGFALKAAAQFPFSVNLKECAIFYKHNNSMSGSGDTKLQLFWWDSWRLLMQDFRNSDAVDDHIKMVVEKHLNLKIKKRLFSTAIYAILKKDFECLGMIIERYKENAGCCLKDRLKVKLLFLMTVFCKNFPYADRLLKLLYSAYSSSKSDERLLQPYRKYSQRISGNNAVE